MTRSKELHGYNLSPRTMILFLMYVFVICRHENESTRNIDACEFFDNLICQIHRYCKDSMFSSLGDFNARCSDFEDFIAGVDPIPERNV